MYTSSGYGPMLSSITLLFLSPASLLFFIYACLASRVAVSHSMQRRTRPRIRWALVSRLDITKWQTVIRVLDPQPTPQSLIYPANPAPRTLNGFVCPGQPSRQVHGVAAVSGLASASVYFNYGTPGCPNAIVSVYRSPKDGVALNVIC